jgi:hypothetical protein
MNRRKLILAVLVGLFVLALVYAFWATPRQQRVAETATERRSQRRPASASRVEVAPPDDGTRVRLDLLSREEGTFPGYRRDIFNYPRVAPPKVVKAPVAPPPPPPSEPVAAVEEAPLVPPAVQKALARFTFLGFLLKEGEKTVFLSSEGEIFVVKKGERFGREKEFYVTDVSAERLTIRQGDDPRAITIPLVEQAPLVPAASPQAVPPVGRRSPFGHGAGVGPAEEPSGEEGNLFPPEGQENGMPPVEEGNVFPPEEGRIMEGDALPPGGAADE